LGLESSRGNGHLTWSVTDDISKGLCLVPVTNNRLLVMGIKETRSGMGLETLLDMDKRPLPVSDFVTGFRRPLPMLYYLFKVFT